MNKKQQRIIAKIEADKEIMARIQSDGFSSPKNLLQNGERYLRAVRDRSHFCVIFSVSQSGMSRKLAFFQGGKGGVLNFHQLFNFLRPGGVTRAGDAWRVSGCGMDMVFHTHYCLIHELQSLGFISKKQCDDLAQKAPCLI